MLLKREHWKPAEKQFVMDNIGKLSPHEMARHLRKTEKAVEQYIHRNRIIVNEKVNRNVVKEILTIKFKDPGYFNPTRAFYDAVGISQKRCWALYKGQQQINEDEYTRLVSHFDITMKEVLEIKQLSLNFSEDGNSTGNN